MTAPRSITFTHGYYAALRGWEGAVLDFEWAILDDTWVPDETTQVFMSSVVSAEFTHASYSRVVMTTPTVGFTLPAFPGWQGFVHLMCADPSFGVISGGEIGTTVVLFNQVTNDGDSPIVATYALATPYVANGVDPTNFELSVDGAVLSTTACENTL